MNARAQSAGGRYTAPAIALHWLMAVLLLAQLAMGWYMVDLPKKTPAVGFWYGLHKSIGICAFALLMVRIWWRSRTEPPVGRLHESALFARSARAAHFTLYACMLATPVCGFLSTSFGKHPVSFFGYALPRLFVENPMLQTLFRQMHWGFSWLLAGVIVLHVMAVVYHVAMSGTRFVRRMVPM
jgi:cytochrome b561